MHRLYSILILSSLLFVPPVKAEECSGPTYEEPTCGEACEISKCQDVSFNQDGTLFQCCPPEAAAPELPGWINPLWLAVLLVAALLIYRRFASRTSTN